jgi:diguanylate cyclase (GGDEF)-like protein
MNDSASPPATLLLVDDDPSIIQAASRLLSDFGRCRFARSATDALRLLRNEPVDLVLLDAEMPEMGGLEMLGVMQKSSELADIPVVLLTSHRDEATEEAAFAAGAVDYLSKPIRPGVLKARVNTQLRLSRALAEVRRLSRTDALTGLANRRAMQERLEREALRADRLLASTSVLMIDVDHFKAFNDLYGHAAGDQALIKVAECMSKAASRANDFCARWGGEEFVVLLPDTDSDGAMAVASHLHRAFAELAYPHEASPQGHLSASVGVATLAALSFQRPIGSLADSVQDRIEHLLSRADAALYRAKSAGRSRSELASL